jgi:hypothetical protein
MRSRSANGVPSGKEGAINPARTRVAMFLVPEGVGPDGDSYAIGIIDVPVRTLTRVVTSEWKNIRWVTNDELQAGIVHYNAETRQVWTDTN